MSLAAAFPDFAGLAAAGFPGVACPKPAIMMAMTARTGSTHLCALLARAADVGAPAELFNPRGVLGAEAGRRGVSSFAGYIESIAREPSETLLFKTSWQDFAPLAPHAGALFPNLRVVYLDRKDIIAQAVSLYRAVNSGLWHRRQGDTAPAPPPPAFDAARIEWWMEQLSAEKRAWEAFFEQAGLAPARLTYESFARDPASGVRAFAAAAGLVLRPGWEDAPGFERLADETSRDWIGRMRRHVFKMT